MRDFFRSRQKATSFFKKSGIFAFRLGRFRRFGYLRVEKKYAPSMKVVVLAGLEAPVKFFFEKTTFNYF